MADMSKYRAVSLLSCLKECAKPDPEAVPRLVIIDGCNFLRKIGSNFFDISAESDRKGKEKNARDNARSVLLLVYQLLQLGFQVIFVVKNYYMDQKNTLNFCVLKYLHEVGIVHVLPDEVDDDYEILSNAQRLGAFVISNDKYSQDKYADFVDVPKIEFSYTRNEMYSKEALFEYPGGLFLSDLNIIFNVTPEKFQEVAYCLPSDPMFPVVKYLRHDMEKIFTEEHAKYARHRSDYFKSTMETCEVLENWFRLHLCAAFYPTVRKKIQCPAYFDANRYQVPGKFDDFYDEFKSYVPPMKYGTSIKN